MKSGDREIWPNIKWGWMWAFGVATVFSLWVLLVAEREPVGMSRWTLCAVYFSEAAVAGVILGLLRPWAGSSRWGAAFTGFVITIVFYLGFHIADPVSWTTRWIGAAVIFVLGLCGAGLGVVIYDEEHIPAEREPSSAYQRVQDFFRRHEFKLAALIILGLFLGNLGLECYAASGSP